MVDKLKIRSLNVNGLQVKKKRDLVFKELSKFTGEILMLQETHTSTFDEKTYKIKWGKNIFFSHGTTQSRGVCTILPIGFKGECEQIYSDLNGRILVIKIVLDNIEYILANIYAPVSSFEQEQMEMMANLINELEPYMHSNLILAGDWNVYLNDQLDKKSKSGNKCVNSKYRDMVNLFMDNFDLTDCWRMTHPSMKRYTCRSGRKGEGVTQTRIDIVLIKEGLMNFYIDSKIEAGFKSDHNYITVVLKSSDETRGRGFWKFNNKLLKDITYVNMMKAMIQTEIEENNHYVDKGFLWDYIKMRIRSETMIYSGTIQKLKRIEHKRILDDIERLDLDYTNNPNENTAQQLDTAKNELETLHKEKLASSMFRSKCEWVEEGERNSKYFLNLEKYNFVNKQITSLEVNRKTVDKGPDILKEIKNYYEKLYSINNIDQGKLDEVLVNIPKLTNEQKSITKGLITYNECLKALKSLSNGKTPGLDGITTDFYKFFWIDISTTVVSAINFAFEKGEMSPDQKSGIITLSPKKNKIRTLLKNWRPITLLTVDYKILAKALALRLKTILPDYIDESQFGYIKDRYIGENIRCVIDLNTLCTKDNIEAYAIQIDFEKAFDSVNWDFMLISLEKMNFDPDFVKWVRILYMNTNSCVLNNGHKTGTFNLKRGVHQGCPLSALLFIILVQVLQHMLQNQKDISGLKVGNEEIKILQMADDTTIFTSNLQDVPIILAILDDFYAISGLKTNIDKTVAYRLGKNQNQDPPDEQFGIHWGRFPINLLGITITNDLEELKNENFIKRIDNMEALTKIWSSRNLSMKGKLTIINALLIPKLIYPCTILDVPEDIITLATNVIKTFFWNWKRPKIKMDTLVRKIEAGGIKFPCLDCKIKAWKTIWATRALRKTNKTPLWVNIVNNLLPNGTTLNYLLKCNPNKKALDTYCPDLPVFYKNIILNWAEVNDLPKYLTVETIKDEGIWLNSKIMANNKTLYNEHAMTKNILVISDVLDDDLNFSSHTDINANMAARLTFLDMLQVRLTIPHHWKKILNDKELEEPVDERLYKRLHNLKTLKTKDIYWTLLGISHDCLSHANTIVNWKLRYSYDDEMIVKIFRLPYLVTNRTNLQALQYKIIYKIVNCNSWLHKIQIIDSPTCRFCLEEETIEHFLFSCRVTKQFWKAFQTWWNGVTIQNIGIIEEKHIVLGYLIPETDLKTHKTFNSCILIGKAMIYRCKNMNVQPDIYAFHCDLKEYLTIEKSISPDMCNLQKLESEWGDILDT
jgi:exonuclease III